MNPFARPWMVAASALALLASRAQGQLGLDIGVGPVIPVGKTANQLATGVHAQFSVPFTLWTPPYVDKIPHISTLDFLRPKVVWRADIQYEQMAGPDRPMRVMAAEAVSTRSLPRKATWFISPYALVGVGAFNTQFYLRNPSGTPYAGTADARTNIGGDAGLGFTNFLAGYNFSTEAKFRYVRNALSDVNGTHIPMRAVFVIMRYTFRPPTPGPF